IASLVWLIPRCGDRELPELQVAVERAGPPNRQGAPAAGDMLRAHARVDGPYVELRVYRDRVLVTRCPGDDRCRLDGATRSSGLVMDGPGQYEAIRLSSREPLPPPQAGLEVDVLRARERGARVVSEPPITVRAPGPP